MKREISRFICALICCAPIITSAQTSEKITSPANLYKEGRYLFEQKNYAAATASLKAFVKQEPATRFREEAEYMLVCSAYELKDKNSITLLRDYLEQYPDTPYANWIYALLGACYFYEGKYDEALALLNSSQLDQLSNTEHLIHPLYSKRLRRGPCGISAFARRPEIQSIGTLLHSRDLHRQEKLRQSGNSSAKLPVGLSAKRTCRRNVPYFGRRFLSFP